MSLLLVFLLLGFCLLLLLLLLEGQDEYIHTMYYTETNFRNQRRNIPQHPNFHRLLDLWVRTSSVCLSHTLMIINILNHRRRDSIPVHKHSRNCVKWDPLGPVSHSVHTLSYDRARVCYFGQGKQK